jgi:hypothetical protein
MKIMGTNFYLMTKSKEKCNQYFGWDYELTDTPDWGYKIHIAKTGGGWLPLFDASNGMESVQQLKEIYHRGEFVIVDEYGNTYNWEGFDKRVLQHCGGVKGVEPRQSTLHSPTDRWYDPDMPDTMPVSHLEYGHGKYASEYFTDPEGYEFARHYFR